MKIMVGSKNPVKIRAVQSVVEQVWEQTAVFGVAVPSRVSEMPMTDEETIVGAQNRAKGALLAGEETAVFGVGLEGGVQQTAHGLYLHGWVAVAHHDGRTGLGGGPRLLLPQHISQQVLAGAELGPLMDKLTNDHNVKQKGGAVGILTAKLAQRQDAFTIATIYAFAPFATPNFYQRSN